jgi:hypothetical protein
MTTLNPTLEAWLKQATCGLSAKSASRVRTEIQQHYESAVQASLARGATPERADRAALASLGDARTSNRQYRKVLLTTSEARFLRESSWESRALCSRSKWPLLIPAVGVCAAVAFFARGEHSLAELLLLGTVGLALLLASPWLPIYTPARGRVFRCVRYTWLVAVVALASEGQPWMFATLLSTLAWIESVQISLRRKLPVADWPKHLYL